MTFDQRLIRDTLTPQRRTHFNIQDLRVLTIRSAFAAVVTLAWYMGGVSHQYLEDIKSDSWIRLRDVQVTWKLCIHIQIQLSCVEAAVHEVPGDAHPYEEAFYYIYEPLAARWILEDRLHGDPIFDVYITEIKIIHSNKNNLFPFATQSVFRHAGCKTGPRSPVISGYTRISAPLSTQVSHKPALQSDESNRKMKLQVEHQPVFH